MVPNDEDEAKIVPTEADGWILGHLPEGCRLCIRGMKVVYFMGGDCSNPHHCRWYCPISQKRKSPNAHFIDELFIEQSDSSDEILKKIIYEVKMVEAEGMSFTGGDPLRSPGKIDLVARLIKGLKAEFGDKFHIHLYTSGKTFDAFVAETLDQAGLDELRFHPDEEDFYRLEYAAGRKYAFGAEVPVIPGAEYKEYLLKLADHLDMIGAEFLNLNEFEMCEPNQAELQERGYCLVSDAIAAVKGSREAADAFINEFKPRGGLSVHFCPAALKDGIQIRNRYIRRANHIKREFEEVSEDGTLVFLRIKGIAAEIKRLITELTKEAGIPKSMYDYDALKGIIDLPAVLGEDESFIELLNDYKIEEIGRASCRERV